MSLEKFRTLIVKAIQEEKSISDINAEIRAFFEENPSLLTIYEDGSSALTVVAYHILSLDDILMRPAVVCLV